MADNNERKSLNEQDIRSALKYLSSSDENATDNDASLVGGKYKVERMIGCEGQATVALATDVKLSRKVVLKIYHQSFSEQDKTRILNEGRALANIESPFVVKCFGAEDLDGNSLLVLEHIEGVTLEKYSIRSEKEMLHLFRQLTTGLQAVHKNGLLHLDLKPGNAVVTPEHQLKLIDFGLVQDIDNKTSSSSGSPAYMPPEIATQEQVDERTDVFGLGAIFYFMLTGRPLYESKTISECLEMARNAKITPVSDLAPNVSKRVAAICEKCLQKNPEDRFPNTQELLRNIDRLIKAKSRRMQLVAALVFVCLLAVCAAWSWKYLASREPDKNSNVTQAKRPKYKQYDFLPELDELYKGMRQVMYAMGDGDFKKATSHQNNVLVISEKQPFAAAFEKEARFKVRIFKERMAELL